MGLFTDLTLEYLEPSASRAEQELKGKLSADSMLLVRNIIVSHHKALPWSDSSKENEAIVNAVRKADWVDASTCYMRGSYLRKGIPSANIVAARDAIPDMGFGKFLEAIMPWGGYSAKLNPVVGLKRFGALSIFKI